MKLFCEVVLMSKFKQQICYTYIWQTFVNNVKIDTYLHILHYTPSVGANPVRLSQKWLRRFPCIYTVGKSIIIIHGLSRLAVATKANLVARSLKLRHVDLGYYLDGWPSGKTGLYLYDISDAQPTTNVTKLVSILTTATPTSTTSPTLSSARFVWWLRITGRIFTSWWVLGISLWVLRLLFHFISFMVFKTFVVQSSKYILYTAEEDTVFRLSSYYTAEK